MILTPKKKLFIGIGAAVLVLIGAAFLSRDLWIPLPDNTTYRASDFSFVYPRANVAKEYANAAVGVGTMNETEYNPLVEVIRYKSDEDVALPANFTAYVERQARALCGSDGSVESLKCTDVVSVPFESASGLVGQELTLTLVRTSLADGTVTNDTFGPVYVFNTTEPTDPTDPTDTLRYSAVFVYPAFASVAAASTSPALLTQIIDSLELSGEVSTTTTR